LIRAGRTATGAGAAAAAAGGIANALDSSGVSGAVIDGLGGIIGNLG
jgi:hypothetical protein